MLAALRVDPSKVPTRKMRTYLIHQQKEDRRLQDRTCGIVASLSWHIINVDPDFEKR